MEEEYGKGDVMALDALTAEFASRPLDFLRGKTINPRAYPREFDTLPAPVLGVATTIDLDFGKPQWLEAWFSKPEAIRRAGEAVRTRFASAKVEVPIAWIRLEEDPVYQGGALALDLEYSKSEDIANRISKADRLPIYYLPCQADTFVRMTIPQYDEENVADFGIARRAGAAYPKSGESGKGKSNLTRQWSPETRFLIDPYNPHLFFTAGLTGCSVFVCGDARQPTVTHIGTGGSLTGHGTPYGDDSALFWWELQLLERFQRLQSEVVATKLPALARQKLYEINVNDYMGETGRVQEFCRWLTHQPQKLTIQHAEAFGCVFGIRYGTLWSFYLQESVTTTWFEVVQEPRQVVRKKLVQTKKIRPYLPGELYHCWESPAEFDEFSYRDEVGFEQVSVRKSFSRTTPLSVRPFFPKGGGAARLLWWSKKLFH
jgi:hypothetical protein